MANHESKFTVDNDALTEATKHLVEQFKREVDAEVLTELVKAFPPEDELDEFNSLVGLQPRPKANPRRINLNSAPGIVIEVWGTGGSGSDE